MHGRLLLSNLWLRILSLLASSLVHFVEVKGRDNLLLLLGGIDLGAWGLHSDFLFFFLIFLSEILDILLSGIGLIPLRLPIVIFILEAFFLEHFKLSDTVLLTEAILSVVAHGGLHLNLRSRIACIVSAAKGHVFRLLALHAAL